MAGVRSRKMADIPLEVLIVEDDPVSVLVLQSMVEQLGHRSVCAPNGAAAWDLLQRSPNVRLVISDWMMPEMDGLALCRLIRSELSGSYRYCILLTARGSAQDRLEGLAAGADDYLTKPVDYDELSARLQVANRILTMQEELQNRAAQLEALHRELITINLLLAEAAVTDGLTGLKNRTYFAERLQEAFERARRGGAPLSVIMLDVDRFKQYNDAYGHQAGDEALQSIAAAIQSTTREDDVPARYGGEEFALLLPDAGAEAAAAFAERLRTRVERLEWPYRPVTVSLGVSTLSDPETMPWELVQEADRALYCAKSLGRNRVELYRPDAPASSLVAA